MISTIIMIIKVIIIIIILTDRIKYPDDTNLMMSYYSEQTMRNSRAKTDRLTDLRATRALSR